jgi:hypothetical protein
VAVLSVVLVGVDRAVDLVAVRAGVRHLVVLAEVPVVGQVVSMEVDPVAGLLVVAQAGVIRVVDRAVAGPAADILAEVPVVADLAVAILAAVDRVVAGQVVAGLGTADRPARHLRNDV